VQRSCFSLGDPKVEHPISFGELLGVLQAGARAPWPAAMPPPRPWGGLLGPGRGAGMLWGCGHRCGAQWPFVCPGNIPPSQFPSNMKPPRGCLPEHKAWGCWCVWGAWHTCTGRAGARVGDGWLSAELGSCITSLLLESWWRKSGDHQDRSRVLSPCPWEPPSKDAADP